MRALLAGRLEQALKPVLNPLVAVSQRHFHARVAGLVAPVARERHNPHASRRGIELRKQGAGRRDLAGQHAVARVGVLDDLFDEAVRVILKSRRGSASLLQRALGIGYTRASRLIDIMTAEGIVGEHKGSKAREVLLSLEDWEENQATIQGQGSNQ